MGAEYALVGGGILSFIFIYTMFKLENVHFGWKIVLIFFSAISMLIMGQAAVDQQDNCSWNVVNSTTVGSTTTYGYDYQCLSGDNLNLNFYRLTLWHLSLLSLYVLLFVLHLAFKYIRTLSSAGKLRFKRK